jgi:hypothetical protein
VAILIYPIRVLEPIERLTNALVSHPLLVDLRASARRAGVPLDERERGEGAASQGGEHMQEGNPQMRTRGRSARD